MKKKDLEMKGQYLKVKEPFNMGSMWQKFILMKNYYILGLLLLGFIGGLISLVPELWRTIEMSNISFEYQGKFSKIESGETDSISYESYGKDRYGKYASYYLLEIKDKEVHVENVFGNLLEQSLSNLNAKKIDYSAIEYYSNAIIIKPKYLINGKEFIGYGFLYTKDSKSDILFFLPYESSYSEKTLERILNSIKEKTNNI
ncbi:MAG: hypothetical protein MJ185_03055 [Treponema sp.]|nr:hypothetical protein [Treponema sp.]